jgi:hypothetical protein
MGGRPGFGDRFTLLPSLRSNALFQGQTNLVVEPNFLWFAAEGSVNRRREARVVSPERMLIHNVEGDTL